MRETLGSLQTMFHEFTQTASTDGTAVTTLRDREINNAQTIATAYLRNFLQSTVRTATTTADQQYYHYPADAVLPLMAATVVDGSNRYPLEVVESPEEWNRINSITMESVGLPVYIYPRARDFGIYPIPQNSTNTIELEFPFYVKDMSQTDYTTGTITATANSVTITGAGTTFASWMAGAWIVLPDGVWYRINAFGSTTSLTLETYYEGATTAGATYTVGESPELPAELHGLLAHYAASKWFANKKDWEASKFHSRMFWTGDPDITSSNEDNVQGGIIGAKKDYSNRSDSSIVYGSGNKKGDISDSLLWGTTLSI